MSDQLKSNITKNFQDNLYLQTVRSYADRFIAFLKRHGFLTILTAQFFSSMADNALLFAAIGILASLSAPDWQTPILQQCFVFAYILLAPFVGALADAFPKGRVMFLSNIFKFVGCMAMLFGLHPLLAYAIVGIGAAVYSPAKYGILTEYIPPERLVWANGWMEGLTVASIIIGTILGGFLAFGVSAGFALALISLSYVIAGFFNWYIPKVAPDHAIPKKTLTFMLNDFWASFRGLWNDPLGQVSLAVTTLFWGVSATLRLVVLSWAGVALALNMEQATQLTALVAIGIAGGSVIAAKYVHLEHSVNVLPVGIVMGALVASMAWITDLSTAVVLLIGIGAMAGLFVVPMNALLQHRGHLLMGAGHSIAVQNFNENLAILVMLGIYAGMLKIGFGINTIVLIFGLIVASYMSYLYRKHGHDQDTSTL
jgi:MFS transporter, LPLT family, lysophospholipid transporter